MSEQWKKIKSTTNTKLDIKIYHKNSCCPNFPDWLVDTFCNISKKRYRTVETRILLPGDAEEKSNKLSQDLMNFIDKWMEEN